MHDATTSREDRRMPKLENPVTQKTKEQIEDLSIPLSVARNEFYEWMCDEDKGGIREGTARNYINRLDQIQRKLWAEQDENDLILKPHHATFVVDLLKEDVITKQNGEEYSGSSKRKLVDVIRKYRAYQVSEYDNDDWENWEPQHEFHQSTYDGSDTFDLEEFGALTEAAENYNVLPPYHSLSPSERDSIEARLAQQLGKPKSRVTRDDWEREDNGAKIPSLVMVAQDVGLPPVEIHRADVEWIDREAGVIRIPQSQSSKARPERPLTLADRTFEALEDWLVERERYDAYEGSSAIWLNNDGNRYTSKTLNALLRKLCTAADIETDDRRITWYSIRKTAGTYIREYDSLATASDVLRHTDQETTRESYMETVPEVQRNTINGVRQLAEARSSGEMSEEDCPVSSI